MKGFSGDSEAEPWGPCGSLRKWGSVLWPRLGCEARRGGRRKEEGEPMAQGAAQSWIEGRKETGLRRTAYSEHGSPELRARQEGQDQDPGPEAGPAPTSLSSHQSQARARVLRVVMPKPLKEKGRPPAPGQADPAQGSSQSAHRGRHRGAHEGLALGGPLPPVLLVAALAGLPSTDCVATAGKLRVRKAGMFVS